MGGERIGNHRHRFNSSPRPCAHLFCCTPRLVLSRFLSFAQLYFYRGAHVISFQLFWRILRWDLTSDVIANETAGKMSLLHNEE